MKSNFSYSQSQWGKILAGGIIITIGVILLLKQLGLLFPVWLFSWPMILIVIGLIVGARHGFRYDSGWIVMVVIGTVFLLHRMYPDAHLLRYVWPVAIIAIGLLVLLGRNNALWRSRSQRSNYTSYSTPDVEMETSESEQLDDVVVFGSIKKQILSKDFRGGEMVNIFGGIELNLVNADIQNGTKLELTQIFGGIKLIVPSNWEVVSEVVTIFGGVEDKRRQVNPRYDRKLVVNGTAIFGGIEIHTYG
ncbi:MAG: cell wall-active antibiotics response protein [Cytophagales bacterium]|jgi:predicted membrane protein|nr:cell wall-active antibiotics response protein [Cytophagales bacterium]